MSTAIGVALEAGPVPGDIVPASQQSFGQNIVRYLKPLAEVAKQRDVPPLEEFIVDRCGLVEAAHKADWKEPDLPPEWGGVVPLDGRPLTDPIYLAAIAEAERITARVDGELPWYEPARGLLTVRAMIAALEDDAILNRQCYGGVWDLHTFRFELEYAERIGTRFHFWVSY